MRNSIVEGEPGIFPDPISQLYGAVNRWVRRRTRTEPTADATVPPPPEPPKPEARRSTGGGTE